jgi:ADP-ribosyl-[dinitrogen reductase] hydrolase
MQLLDRFKGALIGLACGDAVGTTVEFKPPGSFTPVTDMVGGGPFALKQGQWTDDTSMALCLAASLIEMNDFNPKDQMDRYCRWWQEGYYSSTGVCFDIGNATSSALRRYMQDGNPFAGSTDSYSAGNGCIMRLAPIPLYYLSSLGDTIHFAAQSSKTTHAANHCIEASQLFAAMLHKALLGESKEEILFANHFPGVAAPTLAPALTAIAQGAYQDKSISEIRGSGYVVESLEAALWCFWHSDSFESAILAAANLGDDADTTAAVCGQIAGAHYGIQGIPEKWRTKLAMGTEIETLASQLYELAHSRPKFAD